MANEFAEERDDAVKLALVQADWSDPAARELALYSMYDLGYDHGSSMEYTHPS